MTIEEPIKKMTDDDPTATSPDLVAENIQLLQTLFPEIVIDGGACQRV